MSIKTADMKMLAASALFAACICAFFPLGACKRSGATPTPANAVQNNDAARAEIETVLTAQQAAWNRGDIPAFLQGYWRSPELTFSGSSGTTHGWAGVLERYKKAYPNADAMGRLEFSNLEFRALGPDAALLLGSWHLSRKSGPAGGVFSLVFQKFPEGWRIIHDHTSVVPGA